MMQPPTSSAMPAKPAATASGALPWVSLHAVRVMLAAILVAVLAKFLLVARINVSWDEFYFLEFAHQYARGELTGRFQTFHVHLFSWLPALGWEVPGQMVAGRFVMAVLYLFLGDPFLVFALFDAAFALLLGVLYFNLFEAELMSRP